jgi:glucose/arabinose dehydrogenase
MPHSRRPPSASRIDKSRIEGIRVRGRAVRSLRGLINLHCNKIHIGGPNEEEWLADFCEYGEGDGKCTRPFGVAVDDNDHVFVSDDWRNTISVFDISGKFLHKWGQTGTGDGELMRPAGLAVDKNGNIYVADWKNHRIQKLSPEGKF